MNFCTNSILQHESTSWSFPSLQPPRMSLKFILQSGSTLTKFFKFTFSKTSDICILSGPNMHKTIKVYIYIIIAGSLHHLYTLPSCSYQYRRYQTWNKGTTPNTWNRAAPFAMQTARVLGAGLTQTVVAKGWGERERASRGINGRAVGGPGRWWIVRSVRPDPLLFYAGLLFHEGGITDKWGKLYM